MQYQQISYFIQRRGMALLAFAFPAVFIVSSLIGHTDFQVSLSAYYWTKLFEKHFFVGMLTAIGVYLILHKGYSTPEDVLLDVGGVCAIGVAFVPTGEGATCAADYSLHGICALIFFGCIFAVAIFLAKHSLARMTDPVMKAKYFKIYALISIIMIGTIVATAIMRILPEDLSWRLCEQGWTLWLETIGIWTFAAFWWWKTKELDSSAA